MGNHAFFRDNLATIILKKRKNTKNVLQFLSKFKLNYPKQMRGNPQFSFWVLIALAKIFKLVRYLILSSLLFELIL